MLSAGEFAAVQKGCSNCKFILEKDITLPVILDPGAKGCVTKAEFEAAMLSLVSEFGPNGLSSSHDNYETIVRNYLNHRWGFGLSYDDYKQYQDRLATEPGAILCNQILFKSFDQDHYACMKSLLTTAIINGKIEYDAYLKEERQKFQVGYINTCKAPGPSVHLTAEQQVYHYTLYYYDQAGNLVRTVPPEGVSFLSNKEMEWVRKAREASQNCNYTGPLSNTDKATTLQYLSNNLNSGSAGSIEYWQYNENGGGGQVLTGTPDKKFMYHSCLNGNYLNIEVFSLVQNSPDEIQFVLSNQATVDVSSLLPLHPWTHIVVQSANLASGTLSVYVNGTLMPVVTGAPAAGCGWEVAGSSTVQLPENLAYLKYLRLYNRQLNTTEIAANAAEDCFGLAPAYAADLQNSLMHWGRFNTPGAESPTLLADNSTVETKNVPVYPRHSLTTSYAYNSQNQVSRQSSPDGGMSRFWYDMTSRLVFSQNAKQQPLGSGSYTLYDNLSRITEVGEKLGSGLPTEPGYLSAATIGLLQSGGTNTQITATYYDKVPSSIPGLRSNLTQENLRKRVAISAYRENAAAAVTQASYYDYDLMGNVKTLYQQVNGSLLKQLDYEYDLVSGKVNFVRYQHGQNDRFYYAYKYDAENRLTKALTGTEALVRPQGGSYLLNEQMDASYDYYLHGPLARMELGQNKVQGVDYAYTLQGWLKGVNSTAATEAFDIGKDGAAGSHSTVARDAYGFALHYYTGDYTPVDNTILPFAQAGSLQELYNGNIAAMSVNVKPLNQPLLYKYRYDQLNRLKSMQAHTGLNITNNTWNATAIDDFKETITYDGNGNILSYDRNGNNASEDKRMDVLTYAYNKDANGRLVNNRLRHVKDEVPEGKYPDDIDSQPDDNYGYDAIGNLVRDDKETITSIDWNVYGKISRIAKTGQPDIKYHYDASGNRVIKIAGGKTNYYIRDAQGNTLAVYEDDGSGNLTWKEQALYGSSRLGMWTPDISVSASGTSAWGIAGKKLFELTNHLGNVLAVVNDVKTFDGTAYNPTIISANDYYPGGMGMPGRKYSIANTNYRYGFNGKENDNEAKGDGNQQDYGMRIYDPRLVRFLSVDPITKKYPELTPYQFASNRTIDGIDLDGLEYATFHIYVNFKSGYVTSIKTVTDYDLKSKSSMGPGVKYVYHDDSNGNEVLQLNRFEKNIYGIYQGGNNPKLPIKDGKFTKYTRNYDNYDLRPIDETDANAKQHDLDYDENKIAGLSGILSKKSTKANEEYIQRADRTVEKGEKGEKDNVTGKPVTKEAVEAAKFGKKWFKVAEALKLEEPRTDKRPLEQIRIDGGPKY